jgi:hypothetical protein
MSRPHIAKTLRQKVAIQAGYRCGYRLTPQSFTAMPMHVGHIMPLAKGGRTDEENLWLACPLCNGHKGAQTHAVDPLTGISSLCVQPKAARVGDHSEWSADGFLIVGKSVCGRATVVALQLNNGFLVSARRRWVMAGWHPPGE